jgi:hypothetical protein
VNVVAATRAYEQWLGDQLELVPADVKQKHALMGTSAFVCLRATHYRWLQHAGDVDALAAPELACVGDLHVENFGTWRDAEGRLVWGVNDFDESERLPYTYDLARLATSALLAIDDERLKLAPNDACAAVLEGYDEALAAGGRPFVLAGHHDALAQHVDGVLAAGPGRWWRKLRGDLLEPAAAADRLTDAASAALAPVLPASDWTYETRRRVAGVGSLGRRRLVLVGDHAGAPVARELKQLSPPAGVWLGRPPSARVSLQDAVRAQDPFVHVAAGWAARRLAPDCIKLDLGEAPGRGAERRLLGCMGSETANIHLASRDAIAAVRADLDRRRGDWLHDAAAGLARATRQDYDAWRNR